MKVWVSFREKLEEKSASAVMDHTMPQTRIFRLHFRPSRVGLASVSLT